MFMRGRHRPGKQNSLAGILFGGIFIVIGVTQVIPVAGLFGVLWTLMAVVITGLSAYNLLSKRGAVTHEVEVEVERTGDFEDKLRKLEQLKQDRLITEAEYQEKRAEIMKQPW